MVSLGVALGLRAAPLTVIIPNYAPFFLGLHFFFAYGLLSSRTLKQWYGIDHNVSPRYDLAKYGDAAVASDKITQKQLDMLKRNESAHANAVENYAFFAGAVCLATAAGVDRTLINRAGLTDLHNCTRGVRRCVHPYRPPTVESDPWYHLVDRQSQLFLPALQSRRRAQFVVKLGAQKQFITFWFVHLAHLV